MVQHECHSFQADGKSHSRSRGTSKGRDKPVIATSCSHGILSAEAGGCDFESGQAVIVQSTNKAVIHVVWNADRLQTA